LGEEQEERSRRGGEGQQVRRAQMRLSGTGRVNGRRKKRRTGEGDAYAAHFEAGRQLKGRVDGTDSRRRPGQKKETRERAQIADSEIQKQRDGNKQLASGEGKEEHTRQRKKKKKETRDGEEGARESAWGRGVGREDDGGRTGRSAMVRIRSKQRRVRGRGQRERHGVRGKES
jgi:hypothetical protein